MITHYQVKALRNICLKISKLGSNTDQYRILRQAMLDMPDAHARFTPEFIVTCETPEAVRTHLSELFPNTIEGAAYKRRRQFLSQEFLEFIYWAEREALSPAETEALTWLDCSDRVTMDRVLGMMRDCVEVDTRRSLVLSRHAVLDGAFELLVSNGLRPDVKVDVQDVFRQVIRMAEHPTADQEIFFSPHTPFVATIMPLVEYIDRQSSYFSWEEGNRKPDHPTVQAARSFCHAATLLCEIIWQWTSDDNPRPIRQIDDLWEHTMPDA